MINVSIRFDDPSENSDHALEIRILEIAARHAIPLTVAVVPFRPNASGLLPLHQHTIAHLVTAEKEGRVEIALHGYAHKSRPVAPGAKPTEFIGVNETEQLQLIGDGLRHLHAVFGDNRVRGFVPPWNSYDSTTLAVLEKLRFAYISAGYKHPAKTKSRLPSAPCTCNVSQLKETVTAAQRYTKFNPTVVAVMHHFDFAEHGEPNAKTNLDKLDDELMWIRTQSDVSVRLLGAIAPSFNSNAHFQHLDIKKYLHWRLQDRIPTQFLLDVPLWRLLLA